VKWGEGEGEVISKREEVRSSFSINTVFICFGVANNRFGVANNLPSPVLLQQLTSPPDGEAR